MKSGVKRLAVGALAILLSASLILAGCSTGSKGTANSQSGAPAAQNEPVDGGTMIYTVIGDAANLLPTVYQDNASAEVISFVYDSLAVYDDKLNPHPAIAESWDVKDDVLYTFKIRKGVKFHDGVELTAHDVLFTYLTIAHPKYQGVRFGDFTSVKGWKELGEAYDKADEDLKNGVIDEQQAEAAKFAAYEKFVKEGGMRVIDDYTFQVEAAEPFAPLFLRLTGYGIMPKHLLEPDINDLKHSKYAREPVGTGMMKFVEWVKDDHITLVRNPDWKLSVNNQGPLHFERMIIKVVPDQQANMIALETSETDLATIIPEQYDHFKNDVKHVNIYEYMTYSYTFLGYHLPNPMFSDRRVRQAITHAIPRQEIVDKILMGHGSLANSHASPVRWDYNPNVPVFEYNPEKAAKLLDEAGWKLGADGIREKDGQKFKFEIATNSGNKIREQSAVIIQQALKKVGIEVTVELMEWNAFLEYIQSDEKQAYILGWNLGWDPDSHSIFHSKGGFNDMKYSNPRVDELLIQGRTTTDPKKRAEIYGEVQKILAEDQVYSFLFFGQTIAGLNSRVQGAKSGGPAGLMWNLDEWWINDTKAR